MRLPFTLFLFLLITVQIFAQREAANWIFGNDVQIDFNSGNPVQVDSDINTIESSSVISDSNGGLLFYTDGENIYNKDFEIMANGEGILGHRSSTNGAVIIPVPGNNTRYYVFTSDAVQNYQENGGGNGLNYSIVDISLQGGLGEVVAKNVNLLPATSEKLTAVANQDSTGFWILTHFVDTFYAYEVTDQGISLEETTEMGTVISNFNNMRGALKFSPDGSKVAIAHSIFTPGFSGSLLVYDFDNDTGVLSNQRFLGNDLVYYGVEFSSNSEVLYASGKKPLPGGLFTENIFIYQFDLNIPNPEDTRFLLVEIESNTLSDVAGALQIGVDCKIYHTIAGTRLSVIQKPNRLNANSNFEGNALQLTFAQSSLGLPLSNQSFFDTIIEFDDVCANDMTQFLLNTSRSIVSVDWDFGDVNSGSSNESQLISPTHVFSDSGTYDVTATVTFVNGDIREYRKILFIAKEPQNLDVTLLQCDIEGVPDGITFFNLEESISLFFSDLDTENTINVTFFENMEDVISGDNSIPNPISYENNSNNQVVFAKLNLSFDCFFIGQVNLVVQENSNPPDRFKEVCDIVGSEEDVAIVLNEILLELDEDFPNLNIRLYTSIQDAVSEINDLFVTPIETFQGFPGLYYRVENGLGCLALGFIELEILESPEQDNAEVILCDQNEGVTLSVPDGYSYLWSTGETTSSITVFETGNYEIIISNNAGCEEIATFFVVEADGISVTYAINDFQQYNSIVITNENDNPNLLYSIDGGLTFQTSPVFDNLVPGYYSLLIMASDSCSIINEIVLVRGAPRYFTPNGDGFNDLWHVNKALDYQGLEVEIFDRFGKQLYAMDYNDRGWDGTYKGVLMPSNAYWYRINFEGQEYYGHFSLIRRRQ